MRKTKNSIYTSLISLLLCISMLMGTTFAWFTDVVTSNGNVIQSGKLDAQMFWSDEFISADADGWNDAENQAVFTHNKWEPGYTDLKYVKIHNGGSLNFKWKLTVEADGPVTDLANVIDVYYVNPATNEITSLEGLTSAGTLTKVMSEKANSTGSLTSGQSVIIAIAFHMQGSAGNEYKGKSLCDNGFSLKLLATQETGEFDSFGDDYDSEAEWDEGTKNFSASAPIASVPIVYGQTTATLNIGGDNGQSAVIPSGVKVADGATSLDLAINAVDSNDNLTLGEGESAVSMDVHIHGVAADNTQPMIVNLGAVLPLLLNETEVKLYHTENGTPVQMTRVASADDFSIHNQFTYNPATGEVSIYVATFSVFSAVKTNAEIWDGTSDTAWYNENDIEFTLTTAEQFAGFRDLVDGGNTFEGKTVKLATDIDLNNKLFNPIGGGWAYTGGNTFNGTFDGGNHTIYNIYVNGWELDATGDTHSGTSKGAGLFSSIHNATIKNLAISGANMRVETTSIGVVVGCAQGQCTFENIIVTNAVLGNYQMRNGGIVGDIYVIDSDNVPEDEYTHTFKNIVVDSTVTLCSMWGDFDTGNGGVIGGKYGSAKVLMQNVVVACKLDVFSDVTAAYQWYAYRRCGMLIGYTGQNSPKQATNAAADFLTCENVDVYYGDWTNYTYYQFSNQTDAEGNRLWYSNYPWVRAEESVYNGPFSNVRYGNPVIKGEKINTLELAEANKTGFAAITFNQLYGGGQGVYGTNEHANVTTHNDLGTSKTVYIYNDQNWENLKLLYWFRNGEDTWTTNIDGVDMSMMQLSNFTSVYRLRLPAYVDGFKITADGENEVVFTLADLEDGEVYTLGREHHEHSYTDGGKCVCGAYETGIWQLVTDTSALNAGDQIIIAAKNSNVALGVTQNDNNRSQTTIVKNNNTITINDGVQIILLENGNADDTFAFNVEGGYLYAASSSKNYLRTEANLSNNSSWSIDIAQDGSATIKAKGSSTHNWLRYNSQSSIFSCYESGQQEVVIYKLLGGNDDTIVPHNCLEFATGASCEDNATCTKCGQVIPDSALGHDIETIVTEATCTTDGGTTEKCSRCNFKNQIEIIVATGHDLNGTNPYVCTKAECGEAQLPEAGSTLTIQEALWVAETLENGKETSNKYVITGVIDDENHPSSTGATTITADGYSIYITNIKNADDSIGHENFTTKLKNGDTITVSAKIAKNASGESQLHETWLASHTDTNPSDHTCDICGVAEITDHVDTNSDDLCDICGISLRKNTVSMNIFANQGSLSNKVITWTSGDVTVSNEQGSSTSAILTTDTDLFRVYANSTFTISASNISKVVITCTSNSYATACKNSFVSADYTATVDGSVVTITLENPANIVTATASAQFRINKVEVTYSTSSNDGGDTTCEHTNITTTSTATCTVAGIQTITCDDCGETVSTEEIAALGHTTDNGVCERCKETIGGSTEPSKPTVVLEITKDDFNGTSYAANNNTKTENGYSYTSYQVMNQSSTMQWQKSNGYITIASNTFEKLELKSSAGTFTVTVGGKTVTGTTANGVTTYDLTGLTGAIKISVSSSATGKVEYLKFYK